MLISFTGYMIAGILFRHWFAGEAQLIAFILNGVLVWWVYRLSLKKRGYYFYYFGVDGLMLLSALTHFLATI
jgi:hypothetical protein